MSELRLEVDKTNTIEQAKSNRVYISPADFKKLNLNPNSVVEVRNTPSLRGLFRVAQSTAVADGKLLLNSDTRSYLQTALAQVVYMSPVSAPKPAGTSLVAEVELGFALPKNKTKVTYENGALNLLWTEGLEGFPLNINQRYVMVIDGVLFHATITSITWMMDNNGKLAVVSGVNTDHVFYLPEKTTISFKAAKENPISIENDAAGQHTVSIFKPGWTFSQLGVGGLDDEFTTLLRRAFASRIYPPAVIKQMGLQHVKGILLYGPPGTGKTLMARQIGQMLNTVEPVVVNGPSILSKFVGESEKNIRDLFEPAIKDMQDTSKQSPLHLIIFDEIDAICKKRGSTRDSTGVSDSIVNQLLSMIDGYNALDNVLLVGMTNRKDLIDEAMLRPGRFEVQIEVNLPDEKGRQQIFEIHTKKLRESKRMDENIDSAYLASKTENFSGAEIAGVVKGAASFAMSRNIDINDLSSVDPTNLRVSLGDFESAIAEVEPSFGVVKNLFDDLAPRGIIDYDEESSTTVNKIISHINTLDFRDLSTTMAFLIEGPPGCGSSAIAGHLADRGGFTFVRVLSARNLIGRSEDGAASDILAAFEDAHKSDKSALILDDVDMIIEFSPIGPRFANRVLQAILTLIKTRPPHQRKLAVFVTTHKFKEMELIGFDSSFFSERISLNYIKDSESLKKLYSGVLKQDIDVQIDNSLLSAARLTVKKAIDILDYVRYSSSDETINPESINAEIMRVTTSNF